MTNKEMLKQIGQTCSYEKSCEDCEVKEICTKDLEEELDK